MPFLVAALTLAPGLPLAARAQTTGLLTGAVDGGFEAGGTGWVVTSVTQLVVDGSAPVHGGSAAAHLVATRPGIVEITTQYWLVPTVPGVEHTLRVWVYEDDPRMSSVEVSLTFHRSDGVVRNMRIVPLSSSTPAYQLVTFTVSGLDGTAYARITVHGTASAAGAALHVDDVTLERAPLPPPTATPTSTASAEPTAAPTSPAGPTSTAAATASATQSPPATSTATSAPTSTQTSTPEPEVEPRLFDALTNGGFEDGLYGWRDVGAEVDLVGGLSGSSAARLASSSTSTKYLYQTVRITPGAWYAASARLHLGPGVDAAWVRVAWYASDDGSGSQLATGDSPVLTGGDGVAGDVATGPLQAPPEAHTAQVRIMLRPLGTALAQLTVDDVRFATTSAPPPGAAADPTATSVATTAGRGGESSSSPPTAVDQPAPSSPPDGAPAAPRLVAGRPVEDGNDASSAGSSGRANATAAGGRATSGRNGATAPDGTATAIEGFADEIMLRITELLPDPLEPGSDADFEWIEVTNIGVAPMPLAGIMLRDNSRMLALPDVVLQPRVSLVLAGPRAAVPEAVAFWPAGGLFNGLGNSGDRLALIAPDGRLIDALSYGADITYDNPPLPAPGPGRSLRRYFGDDGTYAGFEVSDVPSPGRTEPPPPQPQATPGIAGSSDDRTTDLEGGGDDDRMSWIVLASLGTVALAAAGGQRAWALLHRE